MVLSTISGASQGGKKCNNARLQNAKKKETRHLKYINKQ